MRSSLTLKSVSTLAAVASLAALSACSDATSPTSNLRPTSLRAGDIIPTPAQVVVPGVPPGDWTSYIPNESGRATTEFWDNVSSDDRPFDFSASGNGLPSAGHGFCNVGAFTSGIIPTAAAGTTTTACGFQTTGSAANIPANTTPENTYGSFWGDGGGALAGPGRDASAFMFNGTYEYDLTLLAAYSQGTSTVGYFTKVGTTYTLHPLADFSNKDINATVSVPAGATWGLYLTNNAALPGTDITDNGCAPFTVCSDATGSFDLANLPQHFAMFKNNAGTNYIIGVEDANLRLLPNAAFEDSDYNDYIFRVAPRAIPSGGCTYTKGWYRNHGSDTIVPVDGLSKATAQAIFNATPGKPGNVDWTGSNDVLNLYQQLLAALLNGGLSSNTTVVNAITAAQAATTVTVDAGGIHISTTYTQAQVSAAISTLSSFNEGTFAGFPHCGD